MSNSEAAPKGFLFLCPPKHFRTGRSSLKWPDCPAYWSLDASGAERLTPEDATNLGFPSFQLSTEVIGKSWDDSVYAGLRQFHRAKGFDPDSQDLARHLGDKLYRLSGPFAHIDGEDSEDGDDSSQSSTDAELEVEPDSTSMNHDVVPASTPQDMPVTSALEDCPFNFWSPPDRVGGLSPRHQIRLRLRLRHSIKSILVDTRLHHLRLQLRPQLQSQLRCLQPRHRLVMARFFRLQRRSPLGLESEL
ncbi:hypothetical protein C8R45DRAFT_856664 [Mycena sanguinolenta]|nr:hypothetical protein C8R45DRAFT_856664 [Mycena sanguinolenta]